MPTPTGMSAPGSNIESADDLALVLKKSVAVVHSSGHLSLLGRKLFNALLLHAYDELPFAEQHVAPTRLICEFIGYNSNSHGDLLDTLAAIRGTELRFNLLNDDVEVPVAERTVSGLISEATIGDGVITYSFGPKARKALHNPSIYASVNLRIQRAFASNFSLSLHENIVRFKELPQTPMWPLELFRELSGATAPVYDRFAELSRRVINVAVKEINQHSEIRVEPKFRYGPGKGKPVIGVQFLISKQLQKPLFGLPETRQAAVLESPVYRALVQMGLGSTLAMAAVVDDPERAAAIVASVKKAQDAGKIKKSPGALARSLLASPSAFRKPAGPDTSTGSGTLPASPPSNTDDDQAQQRLHRAKTDFERERRAKLFAEVPEEQLQQWYREYCAQRNLPPDPPFQRVPAGARRPHEILFVIHATQRHLGAYDDEDLRRWMARR